MNFMDMVGREGPLLDAVRKLRQTGDRDAFSKMNAPTNEEGLRARKVRGLLFGR
jgi:hypothetical protein